VLNIFLSLSSLYFSNNSKPSSNNKTNSKINSIKFHNFLSNKRPTSEFPEFRPRLQQHLLVDFLEAIACLELDATEVAPRALMEYAFVDPAFVYGADNVSWREFHLATNVTLMNSAMQTDYVLMACVLVQEERLHCIDIDNIIDAQKGRVLTESRKSREL
jgi:hypothetical protein